VVAISTTLLVSLRRLNDQSENSDVLLVIRDITQQKVKDASQVSPECIWGSGTTTYIYHVVTEEDLTSGDQR